MEETVFYLFGFKLMELGNFVTDMMMAATTYTFYLKLKGNKSNIHFSYFFLFMALSSFIGGFGHLLFHYTGTPFQIFGWIFSALAIYFIELSALKELKSEGFKKKLNFAINIQFVLFIIFVLFIQHFVVVTTNMTIGIMGLVIPIFGIQAFQKNRKKNILIISGLLLASIPAFLYKLNFDFGGLSGKETSHLILVLCFYIVFLGANTETVKEKAVTRL